jgi:hypothetical protein
MDEMAQAEMREGSAYISTLRGNVLRVWLHHDGTPRMEFLPEDERQRLRHRNGAPMFSPTGMMLDEHGNRAIFDDVDE